MNLPNIITLSRIPLMFIIVAFMYAEWVAAASAAFWLFIITAVGDWLDGYLARKQKLVSTFGKFMDALTDKILVLGIMVAFVEKYQSGFFVMLVLLTLCREFLVSGMRMVAATKGVVVAAERGGKAKTLIQMIAIGVLLAVPMFERDLAGLFPFSLTLFVDVLQKAGLTLFTVSTLMAVSSGTNYVVKYRKAVFDESPQ